MVTDWKQAQTDREICRLGQRIDRETHRLEKRIDRIEQQRRDEKQRRFERQMRALLAVFWLEVAAVSALSIARSAGAI